MDKKSLTDEEYKYNVLEKYGSIKGLAQTLLAMRAHDAKKPVKNKKEDLAIYIGIKNEADIARRKLNKLHLRILYAIDSRNFGDIPLDEIEKIICETENSLKNIRLGFIAPNIKRQAEELMLEYKNY